MKKVVLALVAAVLFTMTGCQAEKTEREINNSMSLGKLYASDLFDDSDAMKRAVLTTKEGMILIDEEGNYLSDVYDKIEESDLGLHEDLIRYEQEGNYGYISVETGDVIIEATYNYAVPFTGKLSFVGDEQGKWLINRVGEKVSDLCFEEVTYFDSQGAHARVKMNGKWGVVDNTAQIVVPFEFEYINELPDVLTVSTGVKNGVATILYYEFDEKWRQLELENYCGISEMHVGLWAEVTDSENRVGIVDANGNTILGPKYKDFPTFAWCDEEEFVITTQGFDGKYGAVYLNDNKAYEIIPAVYDNELRFSSDKVAIAYKDGMPGIVDCISHAWSGMLVDHIDAYKGDVAHVHMDEQYGFLYGTGRYATEPDRYIYAEEFSRDRGYTVVSDGTQKGLIDRELNTMIPCVYDEIYTFDDSDYIIVKNDRKYSIFYMREVDYNEYEMIGVLNDIKEIKDNMIYGNCCTIKAGNKWYALKLVSGFVDKKIPVKKGENCSEFYTF